MKSFGAMTVAMKFLTDKEQLQTQIICVWFYNHGTGRVQTKIRLDCLLFTNYADDYFRSNIVKITNNSVQVVRFASNCRSIVRANNNWISVQVKPNEIFQLNNFSQECRTVKVLANGQYRVTLKENLDISRSFPALVKVITNEVLIIAGIDPKTSALPLSTVSCYNINDNICSLCLPELNEARSNASACSLQAKVYVFCGRSSSRKLNSIEMIS